MPESSLATEAIRSVAPCTLGEAPVERTPAERFMRRVLFISDRKTDVTGDDAQRIFSASILVSAVRCTLAYVVFPIFAPALYATTNWGPAIGLTVGAVALVFDVVSIRRFWLSDHRYRWPMTGIYLCVIALVISLVVNDIAHIVG